MSHPHLPVWRMERVPPELCDSVVKDLSGLPKKDATMGADGKHSNHSQRNTDIRFAPPNYWFTHYMFGLGVKANTTCEWDFAITDNEAIQFAEYGPEQHYDWHIDTFLISGKPMERKVTVVCLLNDPEEFVGGEFDIEHGVQYMAPLFKGAVIAFPSFLYHRVRPVTEGVRRTATMWLNGPRLK
jgi:PKHD-type hydroxylase